MRAITAVVFFAAMGALGFTGGPASAHHTKVATTAEPARPTDISAQSRRRPRVRIYRSVDNRGVYPSYFPGSNAVRDCNVTYVQEFRPSGTVIVPNMKCFWRRP